MFRFHLLFFATLVCSSTLELSAETLIEAEMVHLRIDGAREWDEFSEVQDAIELRRLFECKEHDGVSTVSLRQRDVKQRWEVRINGESLGRLVQHEEDLVVFFEIPAGVLANGTNELVIKQTGKQTPDDVLVGEVALHYRTKSELHDSTVVVEIVDQKGKFLPGRITLVNSNSVLMPCMVDETHLAARTGVVYTSTGKASFRVPHGSYRVFAGRGFEYGVAKVDFSISKGDEIRHTLVLHREVDTSGWVACDTHVHTLTHSGHGDCSIEERMITLAGEGIEMPIATDHNKQIDYRLSAAEMKVASHFTPVIGNEVTTKHGHFNVFPATSDGPRPNHQLNDWSALFKSIYETPDVKVAILNHGRDIHSGFRPFSPRHHVSLSGENLDGWDLQANAMEILNSGATQTDPMELFRDWCGLVNHGCDIVPIGCSDSHDVSRYIVGQGRTYLLCDDTDPGAVDVSAAIDSLVAGRLIVSYGLMADVSVSDQFSEEVGPGDMLIPCGDHDFKVEATIRGPHWCNANTIELFINGERRQQVSIAKDQQHPREGVVCETEFVVPRDSLANDAWISVVALGSGIMSPHWRTAKPYQPDSPHFEPQTFSCCGPIRIDINGDGEFSTANEIARELVKPLVPHDQKLAESLSIYDSSVAIQVAVLTSEFGISLWSERFSGFIAALPATPEGRAQRRAINAYRKSHRDSENARLEGVE